VRIALTLAYAGPVNLEQIHDAADRVRLRVIGYGLPVTESGGYGSLVALKMGGAV
jgi:hypothetical protein